MTPLEQNTLAFEAMVSTRRPWLHNLALRQLGNHADAEDVVQEALLRAHSKLSTFRGESSLSTWLVTIVMNCARMHRRHSQTRQREVDVDTLTFEIRDPQPSAESLCLLACDYDRTLDAIEQLSPILREPLLHRMAGRTLEEIAASLHRPVGSVKAQLNRARIKLRCRLNPATRRRCSQ